MQILHLCLHEGTYIAKRFIVLGDLEGGKLEVQRTEEDEDGEAKLFGEFFDVEDVVGGGGKMGEVVGEEGELARVDEELGVFFQIAGLDSLDDFLFIHLLYRFTSLSYFKFNNNSKTNHQQTQ